ncbi:MAG TPA: SDR family NAD(P)-dependent oxidoreductase [Chloroflexota bacterium]|nr:SDR family NAD(P)-dependent oxidoreductase [Chloroflexota bacterium]
MVEPRLQGKVVLITGGGGEFGRAIGWRCAFEGADIVLADLNHVSVEKVAAEITETGRRVLPLPVDVTNGEQVHAMVNQAVATFGHVDVLVNNAGIFEHTPFLEISEASWDQMFGVHVKGTFLCSQAVLRHMVAAQIHGCIISLGSVAGLVGFAASEHYCAAKAAIIHLSKAMALEFGPLGIRVNAISPGTFQTRMNSWILEDPMLRESSLKSIPIGYFGSPEDVAAAVAYLASDDGRYVTGVNLVVDGGQITHV